MRSGLVIAAMLLFGSSSAWACSGKIISSKALTPLVYSPFAPVDQQQNLTIKIQNSGSDHCVYRLSIPDRYFPLQFAPTLQFAITGWGGGSGQNTFATDTPPLQRGQSYDLHLQLFVYRGQDATAGILTKLIGLTLTSTDGRSSFDEVQLPLSCTIPQLFEVNLAGSGTRTSMEFKNLSAFSSRSVVMQTRATQGHHLEISTTAGQLVRDGSPAKDASTISYTLAVDGQTYRLAKDTVLRVNGSVGQASRLLTVRLGDTSNKLAGIYKAIITIRIVSGL